MNRRRVSPLYLRTLFVRDRGKEWRIAALRKEMQEIDAHTWSGKTSPENRRVEIVKALEEEGEAVA